MSDRVGLARHALREAMQLRRQLVISRESPVNAFDIAQMAGLDVRFLDAPSLDGMYVRDPGVRILLPSLKHRPRARVLFSCAHEIGHHRFDHGTTADEYLTEGRPQEAISDEEFLADSFARHLLMPRAAIMNAFSRRGWAADTPAPTELFVVACEAGVGYNTLLNHMTFTLDVIARNHRDRLARTTPKAIKMDLAGSREATRLFVADASWDRVPIDAELGEMVLLPRGVGGDCPLLRHAHDHRNASVYLASARGQASLAIGGKTTLVRVASRHYIGPYSNRYLPDPDEH